MNTLNYLIFGCVNVIFNAEKLKFVKKHHRCHVMEEVVILDRDKRTAKRRTVLIPFIKRDSVT